MTSSSAIKYTYTAFYLTGIKFPVSLSAGIEFLGYDLSAPFEEKNSVTRIFRRDLVV